MNSKLQHRNKTQLPRLHRAMQLQHRVHSGKLLHHKHTSYRSLAVIMFIAGALMIALRISSNASAAILTVSARNPAPIPTDPPVILQPVNGFTTKVPTITVSGTCPVITPRVNIEILENGSEAGSTPCDINNNFTIIITLTKGQNVLVARSVTITGDDGPDSTSVTVTYNPPPPPVTPTKTVSTPRSTTPSSGSAEPPLTAAETLLVVTADKPFVTFGPITDAAWSGNISGGTTPYSITIDWGDGSEHAYTRNSAGAIRFTHSYPAMHSFVITMRFSDKLGQYIIRQYAAVTPFTTPPNIAAPTESPGFFGRINPLALYGAYLLMVAIFGYLWMVSHPYAYAPVPVRPQIVIVGKKRRKRRRK